MADDAMRTPAPVPPGEVREETRKLLADLADTLDRVRPGAEMTEGIRLARPLALAERLHGPGPAANNTERELLAVMPRVRDDETRGEYATRLRLIAQEVAA
ncbi:hypothetical protein ACFUJU_28865 [Streptomyces sp. NPDC057235]|uniref:hypothetical protein n=1 Tax=Streptomyces sp. NPDC057235 TaxID=3346058 RepID=UPI003630FF27